MASAMRAEVGVFAVEHAEGVACVEDVDQHDAHVGDVGFDVCSAVVVDVGGDLPDLGFVVGVEPPALVVAVGEVDAPGVGRWAAI